MKTDEPISTSSPASGDSPSPPDGPDLKQSPFANGNLSLDESSANIGPTSPSSRTCKTSTVETTGEQLCLPAVSLANLTVTPGSDEARRMTATSGEKWHASYRKPDLVGCLVRTLLASSRWVSTKCFLTWRVWTTPARRSLFRLAPLMPTTDATESGSSDPEMWRTPKATEGDKPSYGDKNHQGLAFQAKMFPTPTVGDSKGARNSTANRSNPESKHAKGDTLCDIVWNDPSGGSLNPTWVEWLMGYPTGFTDCGDSETPSSRKSPSKSSD